MGKRQTECDECGEDAGRFKFLKKICGKRICKHCVVKRRNKKRKEMIDNSPELKEDLRVIKNKEYRTYCIKKVGVARSPGRPRAKVSDFPRIKGSKAYKKKKKSSCYLTLEDKQILLKNLMSRGMSFEEAKERIAENIKEQSRIREQMREDNKSEKEIKLKQQEMIEELWR